MAAAALNQEALLRYAVWFNTGVIQKMVHSDDHGEHEYCGACWKWGSDHVVSRPHKKQVEWSWSKRKLREKVEETLKALVEHSSLQSGVAQFGIMLANADGTGDWEMVGNGETALEIFFSMTGITEASLAKAEIPLAKGSNLRLRAQMMMGNVDDDSPPPPPPPGPASHNMDPPLPPPPPLPSTWSTAPPAPAALPPPEETQVGSGYIPDWHINNLTRIPHIGSGSEFLNPNHKKC